MVKLAAAKKPAASSGPKLAKAGKSGAKAGKASKPEAKKGEKLPSFSEGQVVEFVKYLNAQDEPLFQEGDRLKVVAKGKDEDNKTFYTCVKEEDAAAYEEDNDSVDGDQLYPQEIKKAEKIAVDPHAITVEHIPELDAVLEENDGDPLKTANALAEGIQENTFLLGGAIAELYKGRKFEEYGDYKDEEKDGKTRAGSGWDNFCQEQLGMGGRKALGLISIYRKFSVLPGLDLKSLASDRKIGWVKLEYMAPVVTADNVDELIEAAKSSNVEEFKSTINTDYRSESGGETRASGPKAKRVTFKFVLFEDQGEGVQYVMEQAQKQLGLNLEQSFEAIVLQWASEHLDETKLKKARSLKSKRQKELKSAGVNIDDLKAADAKLEEVLAGGGEEEEGE